MYLDKYLTDVVNDLFHDSYVELRKSGGGIPASDLKETETDYSLTLEVPGVSAKDLNVTTHAGVLSISAKSRIGKEYKYSYRLPKKCDESSISAKVSDGLLDVNIPKLEEVKLKPREIKVLSS